LGAFDALKCISSTMFSHPFQRFIGYVILCMALFTYTACLSVKKYTPGKPFAFQTNVIVEGDFSKNTRDEIKQELTQELDDSLDVKMRKKFLFNKTLVKPSSFDSTSIAKTIIGMENYLHLVGYYRDSIHYDTTMEVKEDQYRVTTNFHVWPGQLFRLDSISYDLSQIGPPAMPPDSVHRLSTRSINETVLKKGDAFSVRNISVELTRLSAYYRDNGFLRVTPDLFVVNWDTLGREMLEASTNPFQQLMLVQQRMVNPTADIQITLKQPADSAKLVRYYIGRVKIFPDYYTRNLGNQSTLTEERAGQYTFFSYTDKFAPKKLMPFLSLIPGDLYQETNYQKTLSRLSSISAWKQVVIDPIPRKNDDSVDFEVKMTPAKKMRANLAVDISYQQGSFVSSGGNLLGVGTSLTFINRNLARGVNESNTVVRYGIEVSPRFDSIQSTQFVVGYVIAFPRLLPRFIHLPGNAEDNARSLLSANFATEYRLNYYRIQTLNFYWGVQFALKKIKFNIRLPNIEYNRLDRLEGLNELIKQNASYKYIFNDGLITSAIVNTTILLDKNKTARTLKLGVEASGLMTGLFHGVFPDAKLYRFIKTEAEFVKVKHIRRSALAWRAFAGAGFAMPFADRNGKPDSLNFYMPFFRQYYAGGAGHMRGWTVRKLGPGSTIKSFDNDVAPDRYGDMALELNFEYRFYMTTVLGYTLEGALFTDIGNIWFIRKNNDFINGEFNLSRLGTDIAVGAGTGLRADLGFIKLRIDYSYKVKNPSPDPSEAYTQNKWFANWGPFNGQVNLGIGYPF
jgi:outer membrane protein insertion porin family